MITLLDADGRAATIEARIDTGFSDDVTLPRAVIDRLRLQRVDRSNFRIGNNETTTFNTYTATMRWHDHMLQVMVVESEVPPVIGVGLLWGHNLSVDFRHGGVVSITELNDSQESYERSL